MTLDQVIERLKEPVSAYRAAWWSPRYGGQLVLFRRKSEPEVVPIPDGLTDADGHELAREFNKFLSVLRRLKGARNDPSS